MNETKFMTLSIPQVFLRCAVPGLFAMLVSSIYVMIDGIFVGRYIGSHALAAVNLAFPIIMMLFAVGDMIAVGSSVKIGLALGEGRTDEANGIFSACFFLILLVGVFFSCIGFLVAPWLIQTLITDTLLAEMAWDYARIFLYFMPILMPLFAMDNYLRICGQAQYSMWMNITAAVVNIFLDWLFLAKLGLGITYAALATAISMSLGVLVALVPFLCRRLTLRLTRPRLSLRTFFGIVHNGSSEFFNNISGSLLSTVINALLLGLGGNAAVAAYGIVMYLDSLLLMALYGILDALQPPISYNVGAGAYTRVQKLFRLTACVACGLSMLFFVGMLCFPEALTLLFIPEESPSVIGMSIDALRCYAPTYLFLWWNMLISSFLTAMDYAKASLRIMLFRSLLFPALFLVLLPQFWDVWGVFLTPAAAALLTALLAFWTWRHTTKSVPIS